MNSLLFPSIERDLEHFPGHMGEYSKGQTHPEQTDADATTATVSKESIYLRAEYATALLLYLISDNIYGPKKEKNKGFFAVTIPTIQLCSPKVNIGLNFLPIPKLAPNQRINCMTLLCKKLCRINQKKMTTKLSSTYAHKMVHLYLRGQKNEIILLNIWTTIHSIRINIIQIIMDLFKRGLLQ